MAFKQKDVWIVFTRRGVDIQKYPEIEAYLAQYRVLLEPKPKGWRSQI